MILPSEFCNLGIDYARDYVYSDASKKNKQKKNIFLTKNLVLVFSQVNMKECSVSKMAPKPNIIELIAQCDKSAYHAVSLQQSLNSLNQL